MEKTKLVLEVIQKILKVAEDLKTLSGSLQAVCETVSNALPKELKADQVISMEDVRGVLADKSRAGHTAEIREILKKYGADRLSAVDPKHYAEILRDAEGLTDE